MPSNGKRKSHGDKVQATLSKYFFSPATKKANNGCAVKTDKSDDEDVIDITPSKRKYQEDDDKKESSKKQRTKSSPSSTSKSKSPSKTKEHVKSHESDTSKNNKQSPPSNSKSKTLGKDKQDESTDKKNKEKEGKDKQDKSTDKKNKEKEGKDKQDKSADKKSKEKDNTSKEATSASSKLLKFSLDEEGEERESKPSRPLVSKNVPQIEFTPSGNVSHCETLNAEINDDDEHSKTQLSSKGVTGGAKGISTSNKNKKVVSSGAKYTPLEQQFVNIKAQYADALLFVECGYKYRFFGEDAEIASKVLKIQCHPDHSFMTASIPIHRLFVHVRRLASAGYKVGVVKQTETTHLKASGDNKSGPFGRELSALYTKSTLIGEDVDTSSGGGDVGQSLPENHYLMCVYEQPQESAGRTVEMGIMCVDPATGDMIHDSFEDTTTFTELETRISHLKPVEVLMSSDASDSLESILKDIAAFSSTEDDKMRLEKLEPDEFVHAQAFASVSNFFKKDQNSLEKVLKLAKPVISCLAALITYLQDFKLHKILSETSHLRQFSTRASFMHLSGQCLRNLEVFNNATDGSGKGSLFWMLNHTHTKFGARLLRRWLSQPLLDKIEIEARLDAVEELLNGNFDELKKVKEMMAKLPDIERGLCSIYHKKSSALEFVHMTKALSSVHQHMSTMRRQCLGQLVSPLLRTLVSELPELLGDVTTFSEAISEKAARDNDKKNLFVDDSSFPDVYERKKEIEKVADKIKDHRREVRLTLKQPSLDYKTVSQIEFLIEVKNSMLKTVPKDWTQISSTKQVSRYHSPYIVKKYKQINALKEQLILDVTAAYKQLLEEFSEQFTKYKRAVNHLATLDCLVSLAKTASQDSFCKPVLHEDVSINITAGRHPIIDALKGEQDQFVPNSTELKGEASRVMVISGPNMGGKSSYIRQVALMSILAQVGSFVPAEAAEMGIVDAVFTRMGASDDIFKGQSTFMLELMEASVIMAEATPRSLVILDELGRGTSTHDGMAIAHATLHHFITKCKCLLLFVTHFPMMSEFHDVFPDIVSNYHMSFLLNEEGTQDKDSDVEAITFLYQLTEGAATKSYGLNVARLAQVETAIIQVASKKSRELEDTVNEKLQNKDSFKAIWIGSGSEIKSSLQS